MLRRWLCLISVFLGWFAFAEGALAQNAAPEQRFALVIGNSSYRNVTVLPNPANDARAMEKLLRDAGFDVTLAPDLSQSDMRRAIREFATMVTAKGPNAVALVYYAGHGVQIDGENYLVPVDAKIERESDVPIEAVRLVDVMSTLGETPARMRIVILDACRNNPFVSIKQTTGRGLAIVDAPQGSIVSYATSPGMEALDGAGENSPFTAALTTVAREPNLPIEQAFKRVRLDVHKATHGVQTPWESSSLTSDFAFFGQAAPKAEPAKAEAGAKMDPSAPPRVAGKPIVRPPSYWRAQLQGKRADDAFEFVIREDVVEAYEEFLVVYASSSYAPRVRSLLERRREMIVWFTAVTVDTALAYQGFIDRYPNSDLTTTAQRLRDRAQVRAQSANFTPGTFNPPAQTAGLVTPANLPAPACSCQAPTRRAEPAKPSKPAATPKRPRVVQLPDDVEYIPPPRVVRPGPSIVIGVPPRRPSYPRPYPTRPSYPSRSPNSFR